MGLPMNTPLTTSFHRLAVQCGGVSRVGPVFQHLEQHDREAGREAHPRNPKSISMQPQRARKHHTPPNPFPNNALKKLPRRQNPNQSHLQKYLQNLVAEPIHEC
jgi:hypothetical protein